MMADPWTIAQAVAELTTQSAAGLIEQLSALRDTAAALGDQFQVATPGGASGYGDFSGPGDSPPAAARGEEGDPQALSAIGGQSEPADVSTGPALAAIGAEIAAAVAGAFPASAPGRTTGQEDDLQGQSNPPSVATPGEDDRQAMPSPGIDAEPEDVSMTPAMDAMSAEIAAVVADALGAWRISAQDFPDNQSISSAAAATPQSGSTADSEQSQIELLRDGVEITRTLLELAQGTGIKVDMPSPAWGS
jgi:hypothetical protein